MNLEEFNRILRRTLLLPMVALLLVAWHDPIACIAAGIFVLITGMFDCLDGIHARNTGRSSSFGAYLDAAVDAVMAGLIYPALIVRYQLYAAIYIFTACFRPVVACMIHACTAETRVRIDPEFGALSENVMLAVVLFAAVTPLVEALGVTGVLELACSKLEWRKARRIILRST